MDVQKDKIETILESIINGNRGQAVQQIREYERDRDRDQPASEGFLLDLLDHLEELYPDGEKLEFLKDVLRALIYRGALRIT